ncbi:MAG: HpcH/HpaI aldolase/citrate lyase family protein [Spirochaetales bacterium]|uniref:HpcH/HpaI aldolase/citrate lyase family protein n=1 Tax=Candidatus Thalassospirochaeta sargassi TaxID=3119039 RepID=A0AAJ1MJ14_9SPIO|nr:HpcH/HpaI aldolase/citrate lyase family protein [Spirochaetales bacterium]
MKHNIINPNFNFINEPIEFNKFSDRKILQYCLGATLYMPGTKHVIDKILNKKLLGLTSMVMCFEDAIKEEDLKAAEKNVIKHLDTLSTAIEAGNITHNDIPLTFLRVRNTEQFWQFSKKLKKEHCEILSGFVFPKFYSSNGNEYFSCLSELISKFNIQLYGMPILEGRDVAFKETRLEELIKLRVLMLPFKELVLNIRVGGTDLSSLFGVRRGINYSIYDILTVRDCLSDILNVFNRVNGYVVSAPVWEYFLAYKNEDLDHLLKDDIHNSLLKRNPILNDAIDGLLREVVLDKANGFIGKTIIHPSHVKYVNAMQAVTKEEWDDAQQIINTNGGVVKGTNKMNEINPHKNWAKKIINRGKAFGVIENQSSYFKLFFESK